MPALPAIAAITGIVGGVSQIGQGNEQNATIRSQVDLEAQKFGWTKEQTEREYQNRIASANKFWEEYGNQAAPTHEESITQAQNELSPQYDEQMKTSLQNLGNTLKSRGFYSQLPGDVLTQNAAAKAEEAKNAAVNAMANDLYQAGQDRQLALQQLGLNTFGTYGQTELPQTTVSATPAVTTKTPNKKQIVIPSMSFGTQSSGYGYAGAGTGGNNGSFGGPSMGTYGGMA